MKIEETISKRFEELTQAASAVSRNPHELRSDWLDHPSWMKWSTNAANLIERIFSQSSVYVKEFHKCMQAPSLYSTFENAFAIFEAAKEDYLGGHYTKVSTTISGELLGDFVGLAKSALREGHKDVAAVLACAALEDALKKYATMNNLDITDKSMQDIVNGLKSKGLVSGAQKTLLDGMPKIRDFAMHANWDKFTEADVNGVIGYVEQFIISHF